MSSPVPLLPAANTLTGTEQFYAVQTQSGVPTDVKVTAGQIKSFGGGAFFPPMIDSGMTFVPGLTSGFAYTIPNGVWNVVFNGTLSLNVGSITMPSLPVNGQIIHVSSMQTITGLAVLPGPGQTVNDFPPNVNAFTGFDARYDASNSTWYLEFVEKLVATSNLTWYVNPNVNATSPGGTNNSGWGVGNDANNGFSKTTPLQTLQEAYNRQQLFDWMNLHQPTIMLADGDYAVGVNINGPTTNVGGSNGAIQIFGANGLTSNCNFKDFWFIGGPNALISAHDITFTLSSQSAINPASGGGLICGGGHFLKFISTATSSGSSGPWPFFFDPSINTIGIFLGTCDIYLSGQFWSGFVAANDIGGFFQMLNTTIHLPATTDVSGGPGFIALNGARFQQVGQTYINAGGVIGPKFGTGLFSSIQTNNSFLSDIPGSTTPSLDVTTYVVGQGFGLPSFGDSPLDPTGFAPSTWAPFQETVTGNCYFGLDDPSGVLRLKQISRKPNVQTANYTLAYTDQDGRVTMNLVGPNTVTVPTNATVAFPIGTEIKITQIGAGQTTIAAAVGVTGNNFGNLTQWQTAIVTKTATNTWMQTGA